MKSILYVAASLMIGASIYGFVDYSKISHHKEFKTMYDEPELKEPVVPDEKILAGTGTPERVSKKEQPVTAKDEPAAKPFRKAKKKRSIDYESFSRAPLREKLELVYPDTTGLKVKEQ